jgi:hypothetical protein
VKANEFVHNIHPFKTQTIKYHGSGGDESSGNGVVVPPALPGINGRVALSDSRS